MQTKAEIYTKNNTILYYKLESETVIIWKEQKSDQRLVSKFRDNIDWILNIFLRIKECFRLQSEKQKIIVCVSFLYSRIESDIFLSHLKNSFFLEKSLSAAVIKIKTAENKAVRETKTVDLLRINKIAAAKELVNIYKCKNYRYINKSKKQYYSSNNRHYKLGQKNINNWIKEYTIKQYILSKSFDYVKCRYKIIEFDSDSNSFDKKDILKAEKYIYFETSISTSISVSISILSTSSIFDSIKTILDLHFIDIIDNCACKQKTKTRKRKKKRQIEIDFEQNCIKKCCRKQQTTSSIDREYFCDRSRTYIYLSNADTNILSTLSSSSVRILFDKSVIIDFVVWIVREKDLASGNTFCDTILETSDILNEQIFIFRIIQSQKTNTR